MSNVLSDEKKQQIIALGRLGWSLRRIEQATGVRRETAGAYLKAAGIYVRPRGGWGCRAAAKPANEVTTDSDPAKAANEAVTDPDFPKPANEVTTDCGAPDLPSEPTPYSHSKRSVSNCEPYRAVIELGLNRGFCVSENLPEAMRDLFLRRQVRLSTRQRRYVALGVSYRRQRRRRERLFARSHLL
jgi:hypothetical protein